MQNNIKTCIKIIRKFAWYESIKYAVCSIFLALLTPLIALLIEWCVNSIEHNQNQYFLICFSLFSVFSFLLVWLGHYRRKINIILTETLEKNFTPCIIDKLNCICYSYFDDANVADIMNQISNNPANSLAQTYKTLIFCLALVIRIVGVSLLYFRLSLLFGITLLIIMGIEIYIGVISNREFNRLFSIQLPNERKLSYIGSLLCRKESVFDIKVNQSVKYVNIIQKQLASSLIKERVGINLKAEKYYLINVFIMIIWTSVLLVFMILGRLNNTVELGLFCTLLGSYPLLTQYQSELSYYLSSMGKNWLVINALEQFMNFEETKQYQELPENISNIVFSHVSFRYPGTENYILKDISFTLLPGKKIALVGTNGSGKSTIIKLLCGLYEPTEGTITVNGKNVHTLSLTSKKRLFSAVFQDFQTYNMTIADNVEMSNIKENYNEDEIYTALQKAGIKDFVDTLTKGIYTNLGHLEKDGVVLSGGQRQRLAIARAYQCNGFYFILDEPTAAMDPIAESQLYQSFYEILQDKGAILVSHRLASAMKADNILVLSNGKIIQSGTHKELISKDGLYREMFNKQASWYIEKDTKL